MIHYLAQFLRGDAHIECRPCMGFQLRKRLHRGKGDAGNHFALFQCQFARLEYLTEDELLKDVHHLRIRTLPGQGFAAEQGAVILLAYFDSIHIVCCLCRRAQDSCQHEGDYTYCPFHIIQ